MFAASSANEGTAPSATPLSTDRPVDGTAATVVPAADDIAKQLESKPPLELFKSIFCDSDEDEGDGDAAGVPDEDGDGPLLLADYSLQALEEPVESVSRTEADSRRRSESNEDPRVAETVVRTSEEARPLMGGAEQKRFGLVTVAPQPMQLASVFVQSSSESGSEDEAAGKAKKKKKDKHEKHKHKKKHKKKEKRKKEKK